MRCLTATQMLLPLARGRSVCKVDTGAHVCLPVSLELYQVSTSNREHPTTCKCLLKTGRSRRGRKIWQSMPRKAEAGGAPQCPSIRLPLPGHDTFRLKCTFPSQGTWQRPRVSEPLARHSLYQPSRQAKHRRDCSSSLSLYKHCYRSAGRSRSTYTLI
jgi:hypothetical protein